MVVLVGLPLAIFIFAVLQGFMAQAGNEKPYDMRVSAITSSTAIINWNTDKKTQAVVRYGNSQSAMTSYVPEIGQKKVHEARLTLLVPATTYYYQIEIDGDVYNDEGVPWSFTTKTKDGLDVVEAVKGATTIVDNDGTIIVEGQKQTCNFQSCDLIRANIGKSCESADYVRCISKNGTQQSSQIAGSKTTNTQPTPTMPPYDSSYVNSIQNTYSEPYPTPTTTYVTSNLCGMNYLQVGDNCKSWSWDSYDTKPQYCREAFDRYILECRNRSLVNPPQSGDVWYFNNAITNIASNSAMLTKSPESGQVVYCRIRVEDSIGGVGHSTNWVYAEKRCE